MLTPFKHVVPGLFVVVLDLKKGIIVDCMIGVQSFAVHTFP